MRDVVEGRLLVGVGLAGDTVGPSMIDFVEVSEPLGAF